MAANFSRLKNNPVKQGKVYAEYEKLCGVQHGGNRKSNGKISRLTQEDIAKELGVDARTIRKIKKLLATNFGRLKNNPVKQGKVYAEYERLCGVQHGGNRRSSDKLCHLKREDIARELGVDKGVKTRKDLVWGTNCP